MFKVQAKHHISWRSGAFQRPACRVSKLYFDGKCLGSVKVHPLPNLHLSPICRTEMIQLSNFSSKETLDLDLNFKMVERSKSGADEHGRGWKSVSHGLCSTLSSVSLMWGGSVGWWDPNATLGLGLRESAAGLAERASRFVARSACKEQQSLRSQGTSVFHWPLAGA